MYVVAIVSQKGGAGKSTLARHGAVLLPAVGLIDLDRQGTTQRWLERRQEQDVAHVATITATSHQLPELRPRAEAAGFEWVVIDTPPAHDDERAVRAALDVADFALVPVQPSPDDLDAVTATLDNVYRAGTAFALVLSRTRRTKLLQQARELLPRYGPVAPVEIRDLVAYPESVISGHAVTEYAPDSGAAADMQELWTWVRDHVSTSAHQPTSTAAR